MKLKIDEEGFTAYVDNVVTGSVPGSFTFDTVYLLLQGPGGISGSVNFDDFKFGPTATFGKARVWINAFIPKNLPTRPFFRTEFAPPPYLAQTAIPGPLTALGFLNPRFLTDQRSFESNPLASSRMHSEAVIDLPALSISPQLDQPMAGLRCSNDSVGGRHCTGTTVMYVNLFDARRGEVRAITLCKLHGERSQMAFSQLAGTAGALATLEISAASSNPCWYPSPDIDYRGTIEVDAVLRTVSFDGFVDEFPAFEMYASIDDGEPQLVFKRAPAINRNPWNLFGRANVHVAGQATFE